MCELFGISAKKEIYLNFYLEEFFSHCQQHPNGWGLACFDGTETFIEKEPLCASKSRYLKERLALPLYEKTAFAHIRKATIGNEAYQNCHPFSVKDISGRRWTQIHNGTIFEYKPLEKYVRLQKGDTDSERILLYMVSLMNSKIKELGRPLDEKERFDIIDQYYSDASKGNKLNILLYDGELTYVHSNYRKSLYILEREEGMVFSTQPLSDENWNPVAFTQLNAYRQGELVYSGKPHGNEYVDNEKDMQYLYQIFANL
jgi:glutamine amidotransferase